MREPDSGASRGSHPRVISTLVACAQTSAYLTPFTLRPRCCGEMLRPTWEWVGDVPLIFLEVMMKGTTVVVETLTCLYPNAAGLDIGAREIWASVPADRDPEPVRCFGTFTPDLQRLVDWLVTCRIDTVAMESTGVYWIPIFDLLENRGLQAWLVEPRQLKRVPGSATRVGLSGLSVDPEVA